MADDEKVLKRVEALNGGGRLVNSPGDEHPRYDELVHEAANFAAGVTPPMTYAEAMAKVAATACDFDQVSNEGAPPLREPVEGMPKVQRGDKVLVMSEYDSPGESTRRFYAAVVVDIVIDLQGKPVVVVQTTPENNYRPEVVAVTDPVKRLAWRIV